MSNRRVWATGVAICLLVLSAVPSALGARASWRQLGKKGVRANVVAMTTMGGAIWSIEADGTLYRTDRVGSYQRVGPTGSFENASLLEALDGSLFMVADGSLYRTNPDRAKWRRVGKADEWSETVALTSTGDFLWSLESDGNIFKIDATGAYERVVTVPNAEFLVAMGGRLWTIANGSLYATNDRGQWRQVGERGGWANTVNMAASNGMIWTLDDDGTLWRTDRNGTYGQVSTAGQYAGIDMLHSFDGILYIIKNGTLWATP